MQLVSQDACFWMPDYNIVTALGLLSFVQKKNTLWEEG
jgi:hypothetical protein